jgi:5'-methylthioadenosine phosphorylase|tara:strand:- start:1444 stop:2235 length:792 start_codon:yes stop_codon:yes gene_type:complete
MINMDTEIAIIGGTGIYNTDIISNKEIVDVETPYGKTSDSLTIGEFNEKKIVFLPRHGKKHSVPPHKINFRANIWALKELGVKRIIAPCAVGSLREEMKPGHIAIPDQFIDRTKDRDSTFYDQGTVAHISTADPFCPDLRNLAISAGKKLNYNIHGKATQVCIEGPRFSTRAESNMFRSWGADTINMTLFPECVLARESQICYLAIATITDYDVWAETAVSHHEVLKTLEKNVEKTSSIIQNIIPEINKNRDCLCANALDEAI